MNLTEWLHKCQEFVFELTDKISGFSLKAKLGTESGNSILCPPGGGKVIKYGGKMFVKVTRLKVFCLFQRYVLMLSMNGQVRGHRIYSVNNGRRRPLSEN